MPALLAAFLLACAYAGFGASVAGGAIPQPPEEIQPPAAAPPVPGASQGASTYQSGSADASAAQQQPGNVVSSIRFRSSGDLGTISQRNVVAAISDAMNDASTTQAGTPGDGAGGENQDAATSQDAGSAATAAQQQPGNIVVIIRINSPGDDVISQDNTAIASGNAGNTSSTTQGSGGTDGAATTPAAEPRRQQPARKSARAPKRRPARDPAPASPRKKQPATPAAQSASAPAASAQSSSYGSAAPSATPPSGGTPKAAQAPAGKGHHAKPVGRSDSARSHRTMPQRLAGSAAGLLDTLTPPPLQPAGHQSSTDVSDSVVYSLLAVLVAAAGFFAWPNLRTRLRLAASRRWRA